MGEEVVGRPDPWAGRGGDVVARATQFTDAFAQPGNVWRAEARELIVELVAEVVRLRAALADVAIDQYIREKGLAGIKPGIFSREEGSGE